MGRLESVNKQSGHFLRQSNLRWSRMYRFSLPSIATNAASSHIRRLVYYRRSETMTTSVRAHLTRGEFVGRSRSVEIEEDLSGVLSDRSVAKFNRMPMG